MSIPQSGGGPIESHADLAGYLEAGCKPAADWRIGTEHEKFGYCNDTMLPLPYDGACSIRAMLEGLRDRFGWDPVEEGGNIIGLVKDGANVSLEPGGQLELSGAPLETIHETCDEVNSHLREVKEIADEIGAGFIGLGAAPIWTHDQMPLMPKGRYRLMNDTWRRVGTHGHADDAADLHRAGEPRFRHRGRHGAEIARGAGAAAGGHGAFSPIRRSGGQAERPQKSWRSRIWRDLDADRHWACCPSSSRTAWGLRLMSTTRSMCRCISSTATGYYVDALGMSFRDFLKGELPALPGEKPTLSGLGRSPDNDLPRGADQEVHGDARGGWRAVATVMCFARLLGRAAV